MKHKIFFLLGSLLILLGGFGYGYTYMLDHRSADSLSAYCDIDFRADTDEHGKISTANLTLQDYRFAGNQLKPVILVVCDNDMYDIKASVRHLLATPLPSTMTKPLSKTPISSLRNFLRKPLRLSAKLRW